MRIAKTKSFLYVLCMYRMLILNIYKRGQFQFIIYCWQNQASSLTLYAHGYVKAPSCKVLDYQSAAFN